MSKRPQLKGQIIEVDPTPTPEEEAEDFQNPDERAKYDHELNLIKAQKGWVGVFTGSTDERMNTGVFILFLLLLALGASEYWRARDGMSDNLIKVIVGVIGYIVGTASSNKKKR
jgi:hypothetical protein